MNIVEATHTHIRSEVRRIARIMVTDGLTLEEACFEESFNRFSLSSDELNYILAYVERNGVVESQ